jgi:DNA-directed RNA polymerase III subunit RPC2
MGKQAIGSIGYNQLNRTDTLMFLMSYPQKPMVKTKTIELSNFENLPAGQNASVAIMSFTGYDIEDASILNKASLDRGFGRAMYFKRHQTSLKRMSNGACDTIMKPPPIPPVTDKHHKMFRKYRHLDKDGLAHIGSEVSQGDIFVNKHIPDASSFPPTADFLD